MKRAHCEREEELTAALAAGSLGEALREHADSCPVCGDVLLVGSLFRLEGEAARAKAEPIQAKVIWRRAERRARERKLQRALTPIALIHKISGAAGAAAATIAGIIGWPAVRGRLETLEMPALGDLGLPTAIPPVQSILLMTGSLAVALVAFGLYSQWADA